MGNLGVSRQFAFIRFYSVPDARAFLEQHYPTLNLGHGADRCRVAFSRERENDDRRGRRRDEGEEEWKCRVVSILHPGSRAGRETFFLQYVYLLTEDMSQCLLLNYPRRLECFRCQTPRSGSCFPHHIFFSTDTITQRLLLLAP